MKSLTRLIASISLCAIIIALAVSPGVATTQTPTKKKHITVTHIAATKWPQTCPVSGTKIASAAEAYNSEVYKGKTYYFCCPMCKPIFDKNPAKVIAAAAKGKYLMPM
jgi:YHS domain-containing protein